MRTAHLCVRRSKRTTPHAADAEPEKASQRGGENRRSPLHQDDAQQGRRERVHQRASEMMSFRQRTIQFGVEFMTQPRKRMPVHRTDCCEGERDRLASQAVRRRFLRNVGTVVEIDECVAHSRERYQQDHDSDQDRRNPEGTPARGGR